MVRIYIPICFYYFCHTLTLHYIDFLYLHSNMFLLFLLEQLNSLATNANLHSNMFLLFQFVIISVVCIFIIYIPICFYYFHEIQINHVLLHLNLHSNMFLLFQEDKVIIPQGKMIYIPICFYYFRKKCIYLPRFFHLHSNMFLLFPKKI